MNISSATQSFGTGRPDPAEFFKKADADGSGGISKDELSTMLANGPQGAGQAGGDGAPSVDEIFAQVDTDGDGEISESENEDHMKAMDQNRPPPPQGGFDGAGDVFKQFVEKLQQLTSNSSSDDSSSTGSTSSTSATSSSSTTDLAALLQDFVSQLKQSGEATNLFSAKA